MISTSLITNSFLVSFQEDEDIPDDSPTIEFPTVFRQASLAPLAAKIRLNRPPTAPAGSIYMNNIQRYFNSVDIDRVTAALHAKKFK